MKTKNKLIKLLVFLVFGLAIKNLTFAQTINIQAGISTSKINWISNSRVRNLYTSFDEPIKSYTILVGIDYLDKRYVNLSSNFGIIRKGGKDVTKIYDQNGIYTGENYTKEAKLDYLSINTSFEFKYPIASSIYPFIGIGSRLDFLINHSDDFNDFKDYDKLKNIIPGILLGGGMKYEFDNFNIGLRSDYYIDLIKVANWQTSHPFLKGGEVTMKTLTINLIFGVTI